MNVPETIIAIAVSTIISAGGIGGIIVAVIRFSSDLIAKRLSQKYELKINKSLEEYRTHLGDGSYISHAMFDKEFEIYQTLSHLFTEAYNSLQLLYGIEKSNMKIVPQKDINAFNPRLTDLFEKVQKGETITEIQLNKLREEMGEKFIEFKKALDEYSAFIPLDNFAIYLKLYQQCRIFYDDRTEENYKKIAEMKFEVQKTIRKYLIGLTIID